MAVFQSKNIGQVLVEGGKISETQLQETLETQKITNMPLTSILIAKGFINEETLHDAMQLQYGLTYFSLKDFEMPDDVKDIISSELMRKFKVLPILLRQNTLILGMVNPVDLMAMEEVRLRAKKIKLEPVVISEDEFFKVLNDIKRREMLKESDIRSILDETAGIADMEVLETAEEKINVAEATKSSDEAPIIKLANRILSGAVMRGASDIHIQPQEHEVLLRYRLDGTLFTDQALPNRIKLGLISRIKIMANLDIAEKRVPQDGRIRIRVKGKGDIDFRVSTLPSKFGEKVVMRILDKGNNIISLDTIIPFPDTLALVRELIDQPYGIIYVTGPTGSGKTTTLYAALAELNQPRWNIVTVEDPIEYDLPGLTQVQVDLRANRDFATVLRSFLRQDPDIILIGETRDKETAQISMEAALTGHMVFTTLHTNDAANSITRLIQMGIDTFLVASTMVAIFAQRLVKRICLSCKEEYVPNDAIIKYFGLTEAVAAKQLKFYRGAGCEQCGKNGYKGRVGIFEIMVINDELKDMIVQKASTARIKHTAMKNGMVSLKQYALRLVQEGYTTLEEVRANILVNEELEEKEQFCPNCLEQVEESFSVCPHCLTNLKIICKQCGTPLNKDWKGCPTCGLTLELNKLL